MALYQKYDDETPAAEVDIACVRNGWFGIAEVKTKSTEFASDDLDKLASVARRVGARIVFVGAFDDRSRSLVKIAAAVTERMKDVEFAVEAVAPPDYVFEWSGNLL